MGNVDANHNALRQSRKLNAVSAVSATASPDAASWPGPIEVQVTFETTLGLLAAFFISFFAPVVAAIVAIVGLVKQRPLLVFGAVTVMVITGRLALLVARVAAEASMGRIERQSTMGADHAAPVVKLPFALAMAALLPPLTWFWKPWLGAWWMAHFCGAAAFGHIVAMNLIQRLDVATAVLAVPLAVVVHFAFLFASNLYLILAARAIMQSPRLCVRLWKHRFLIDFVIALLLVLGSRR